MALRPGSKRPVGPWRDTRPSLDTIRPHVEAGGGVGLVPASVRLRDAPLAVLDVDEGDVDAMMQAYPPLAFAPTRRGSHLWFLDEAPGGRGNGTWAGPGGCVGDVRGVNYAALHGDEAAIVDRGITSLASMRRPRWCDVGWLPAHLIGTGGRRTGEGARSAAALDAAADRRAQRLWNEALPDVARLSIGARVGSRHGALVMRVVRWAGRRTWNGRPVHDAFIAARAAAYWLGLPNKETFPESEAVGVLGWALSIRARLHAQPHDPRWLARQAERGRMGGAASGVVRWAGSLTERQPWADLGVSRATWYRRFWRGENGGAKTWGLG